MQLLVKLWLQLVGPSTVVKSLNFEIIGIWTSVVVLSFARLDS